MAARALLLITVVLAAAGCGSEAPPYVACDEPSDCDAPADGCFGVRLTRTDGTTADGSLCTLECTSDADCPEGGACLAIVGDTADVFVCYARCEAPADCWAGFRCTGVDGSPGVEAVCLP